MGADIHGVLQVRHNNGSWDSILEIENARRYVLFSALAGVRNYNEITPIGVPRGIPADFDIREAMVVMEYGDPNDPWIGDHSFSWLSLEELNDWSGWDQILESGHSLREYCDLFHLWLKYANAKVEDGHWDDARIVFGFDN